MNSVSFRPARTTHSGLLCSPDLRGKKSKEGRKDGKKEKKMTGNEKERKKEKGQRKYYYSSQFKVQSITAGCQGSRCLKQLVKSHPQSANREGGILTRAQLTLRV